MLFWFCRKKMPKTTARCLSLLLEDEAMVLADAVARASIDAGDQRRLSADLFGCCYSVTPTGEPEPKSCELGTFKDQGRVLDINNNYKISAAEEDSEDSLQASPSSEEGRSLYEDDQKERREELGRKEEERKAACVQNILSWLENRMKNGFTNPETQDYVR
jgi:hypothetical protein